MSALGKGIDRIERESIGGGVIYVVEGPDGYGTDRALGQLGIMPAAADVIVYLRNFHEERPLPPALVSVRPRAG
jgi:hypothetical protein